ncbi:tyrosine-type recombinase/integrase [Brevibacillus laterosporus]|uniref:Tyrosine-type recombinase/integrase n=1 Tax=Brevibacillus laterosporus TaxID=1465 RepID=A0AAP3DFS9_BRELA|nr:tyrosine-type recombinase/integrase [Brevibacillus laterosporus]MCR8980121.1 tyrosine-type recombinase/integrase [Brevibacillus laterosporus]MCZ0807276.1 tyrosine-type recombinase/integrase [Brevibacillus laterosporus]MCZ0825615.1 tyrosine-type recombinase/integrase [Brevibacillus laterosporus]
MAVKRRNISRPLERVSLDEALQKVLNSAAAESYRPRTLKDYRKVWGWVFGTLNEELDAGIRFVDEVTLDHFRSYVRHCLDRGLAAGTVNVRVRALKAMFNRLVREGAITENPTTHLQKLRDDEKVLRVFGTSEIKRLLSYIDKGTFAGFRDYCAILLAYDSGLRSCEINSLELNDVDFDNHVILLPGAKNKNRKTRAVPISPSMAKLLKQLVAETREFFGSGVRLVFVNNNGNSMSDSRLRSRMHEYGKRSGLNETFRVSPHTLRHSFATNFLLNGGNIVTLSKILGHADVSTTKRYLNLSHDDITHAHSKYTPLNEIAVSDR